jgi:hypothetical protein
MVAHHFSRIVVARPRKPAGFRGSNVEPHAGGGGDRQNAGANAVLVHVLDQSVAGPGDLAREVRLLARILVIEPEFLIFGRIKMQVGVDQRRLGLGARREAWQSRGCAEGAKPREKTAS